VAAEAQPTQHAGRWQTEWLASGHLCGRSSAKWSDDFQPHCPPVGHTGQSAARQSQTVVPNWPNTLPFLAAHLGTLAHIIIRLCCSFAASRWPHLQPKVSAADCPPAARPNDELQPDH